MASLFLHLRSPFASEVDREAIGRDVTRQWQQGLHATMRQRAADTELDSRFLDISYPGPGVGPARQDARDLSFLWIK